MPEKYFMRSTSTRSSEITDVVLSSTTTTRLVLRSQIVSNRKDPQAGLKVTLAHQRKSPKGSWEDVPTTTLNALKIGEEAKLNLDSSQTINLFRHLQNLYAIHTSGGVRLGETSLVVGREDEIIKTGSDRARIINLLLSQGFSMEIWDALAEVDPDLATKLSYARIQAQRENALGEFRLNLKQQMREGYWQDYFERNTWIFGYGLNYKILKPITPQAHVGGTDIKGRGARIPDFLQMTEATVKFTVLVEIKRPDARLFERTAYRAGVEMLGKDLVGGTSQLQADCRQWEMQGSRTEENRERIPQNTHTIQPKGILVIGHLDQLDGLSKRTTFELYRRNITNPEIITFDELYARASYIVEKSI